MPNATTDDLLDLDPDEADPEDIDLALVRDALHDGEGLVRDRAAELMLVVAREEPEEALHSLSAIVAGVSSGHVNVTLKSVSAVVVLTEYYVDELEPTVEPLVDCLYGEIPRTRAFAAKALGAIAEDHPEWFVPHVGTLVDVVGQDLDDPLEGAPGPEEADEQMLERLEVVAQEENKQQFLARATAANLLYEAVQEAPAEGAAHVDALVDADDGTDATVTAAVMDILAVVGEHDQRAIEGAVEHLIDRLDYPNEQVRARAVKALGFSGDERAVEPLRDLATDDEADPDLRDLAAETADWIEQDD